MVGLLIRWVDLGKSFDKVNIMFRSGPSQPAASKLCYFASSYAKLTWQEGIA